MATFTFTPKKEFFKNRIIKNFGKELVLDAVLTGSAYFFTEDLDSGLLATAGAAGLLLAINIKNRIKDYLRANTVTVYDDEKKTLTQTRPGLAGTTTKTYEFDTVANVDYGHFWNRTDDDVMTLETLTAKGYEPIKIKKFRLVGVDDVNNFGVCYGQGENNLQRAVRQSLQLDLDQYKNS